MNKEIFEVVRVDALREAWDVSTDGYLLLKTDGSLYFGNGRTVALFPNGKTHRDILNRLTPASRGHLPALPSSGLGDGFHQCNLLLNSGDTVAVSVESIPVASGRWLVFRSVGTVGAPVSSAGDFTSAVLDSAEAIILVIDPLGRIVRFNREAEALTGYTEPEVVGRFYWDLFIRDEDLTGIRDHFSVLIAGHLPSHRENFWKMRDGSLREIAWSNTALKDDAGEIVYIVSTGVDISATRRAELALASLSETALNQMQGERRKLSRFLHDTVSQDLVALSFSLNRLQREQCSAPALQALDQSLHLLDRCCRDIRQLSYILAPPSFDEIGLIPAFEWFAGELQREAGMEVDLDFDALAAETAKPLQAILFATLQACVARSIRMLDKSKKIVSLKQNDGLLSLRYESVYPKEEITKGETPLSATEVAEEFSVIRERLRCFSGTLEVVQTELSMSVIAIVPSGAE